MANFDKTMVITDEEELGGEMFGLIQTPIGEMCFTIKIEGRASEFHGLNGGNVRHIQIAWPFSDVLIEFRNGEWEKPLKYASEYAQAAYRIVLQHYNSL